VQSEKIQTVPVPARVSADRDHQIEKSRIREKKVRWGNEIREKSGIQLGVDESIKREKRER
jgi:hypothetical protein